MKHYKSHFWDASKRWKQGTKEWMGAICGTRVAIQYPKKYPQNEVTCLRCQKILDIKEWKEWIV